MEITTANDRDSLMSKVFDYLRFPLIIGVIFIHNFSTTTTVGNVEYGTETNLSTYFYISNLFSQILARVAVPLFFFMSGYLFFYKVGNFNNSVYLYKLKKRFKSLLIPYLFWNTSFLLIYYICTHIPMISTFFKGVEYNLETILNSFWAQMDKEGKMTYPLAYQFWFIRDLIVCVIISPLLYWFVTKPRFWGLILLGIAWLCNFNIPYIGIRGFSTTALFFFSFGAWFSINKKNIINVLYDFKIAFILYPIFVIFDLLTIDNLIHPYIHNIGILIGIVFWILSAAYLIENKRVKPIPFLSSASFFIFAIHDPWLLSQIRKILYSVIQPQSDLSICILYFVNVFLVTIIALGIYFILKKLAPSFTALITGGR